LPFFKENCLIIMCDLPLFKNSKFDLFLCPTCHFLRKWYYYHKLLAPFKKSKIDLFSQVTCPFWNLKMNFSNLHASLKLVYFYGRSTHFTIKKKWSIFTSDLSFFKFQRILASLHASLKLFYFQGRLTHFEIQKINLFS
jgi:hypothetical protein